MEFKLSITNPFKIERKGYYHVLEDKWSKRVLSDIYDFLHFRQKDYGRTSKQIESYQVNALVYTIVNKLTSNTASLPVKAVNDKGEIIENSKLLEVLKKPNEYQSRIEWNQNSLEYLALSGNVFIRYIEGIGAGYELEVLDSANVRILINSYGDLTGYEYTDNAGLRIRLDIEEVLHIKLSSKLTTNLDNK